MSSFEEGDLAVIRGPLTYLGGKYNCDLFLGEVVEIVDEPDEDGDTWVYGRDSQRHQYISVDSLISWDEILEDGDIIWGDDGDLLIEFAGIE